MAADLEQAKPVMDDIRQLLIAREVPGWMAVVALSTLLGEDVARTGANSINKDYCGSLTTSLIRHFGPLTASAPWATNVHGNTDKLRPEVWQPDLSASSRTFAARLR
jgi:hypothetical protein